VRYRIADYLWSDNDIVIRIEFRLSINFGNKQALIFRHSIQGRDQEHREVPAFGFYRIAQIGIQAT
jgi:hypothetical protein